MSDDPIDVGEMIAAYRTVARPSRAVKRRIAAALDDRPAPGVRWWPVAVVALAAAALFVVARGGWAGALLERARVERERPEAPYDNGAERAAAPLDARATAPRRATSARPRPPIDAPAVPAGDVSIARPPSGDPAQPRPLRPPPRAAPRPAREPTTAPSDDVVAEMTLLEQARVHLRAGRGGDALAIVEEHVRRFPGGHLGEERDALRVLASCMLTERRTSALSLKREFLRRYPRSTYAERVRAACPAGGEQE